MNSNGYSCKLLAYNLRQLDKTDECYLALHANDLFIYSSSVLMRLFVQV
jgi:hypothetical protein